jgi:hypothetical protein
VHGHQRYCEQEREEHDPSGTQESVGYLMQAVEVSRHRLQGLNSVAAEFREAILCVSACGSSRCHSHESQRAFIHLPQITDARLRSRTPPARSSDLIERNGEADCQHDRDHNGDTEAAHGALNFGREARFR